MRGRVADRLEPRLVRAVERAAERRAHRRQEERVRVRRELAQKELGLAGHLRRGGAKGGAHPPALCARAREKALAVERAEREPVRAAIGEAAEREEGAASCRGRRGGLEVPPVKAAEQRVGRVADGDADVAARHLHARRRARGRCWHWDVDLCQPRDCGRLGLLGHGLRRGGWLLQVAGEAGEEVPRFTLVQEG